LTHRLLTNDNRLCYNVCSLENNIKGKLNMEHAELVATFNNALKMTKRNNIEQVLGYLEKMGFYESPASSKFHLACKGGLLQHSLNVWLQARKIAEAQIALKPELKERLSEESIAIAALLHDVCKCCVYTVEKRNRKNALGAWEQYDCYVPKYDKMPLGHGEKSVIRLLRMGLELTDDEIFAIRWHMANWDMADTQEAKGNFTAAVNQCPLLAVIIAADQLSTWITEVGL